MKKVIIEWADACIQTSVTFQDVLDRPFIKNTHIGFLKHQDKEKTILWLGGTSDEDGDYVCIPTDWIRDLKEI